MRDITPMICDQFESQIQLLDVPLSNFGMRDAFWGEVETVRCYHDASHIISALSKPGTGKILVIDGHGSLQRALVDESIATLAITNDWEGIVVLGAVRDVAHLAQMDIGIKAIGTSPFKAEMRETGHENVSLTLLHHVIQPGDYLYADWNATLLAETKLPIEL